jgi:hypothetical protein
VAHGHAVVVDAAGECRPHRGAAPRHALAEPAHMADRMATRFHRRVHRVRAVGGLRQIGGLAGGLGQREQDRLGQAGERDRRRQRSGDAQQLGTGQEAAVVVALGEAGRLE